MKKPPIPTHKLGIMQKLSWMLPGLTINQRLEVVKLFKAEKP